MQNNTIEFLERCKEGLRETYKDYLEASEYGKNMNFNKLVTNEDFRKLRQVIKGIANKRNGNPPTVIIDNRTVEEFCRDVPYEYQNNDHISEITFLFNFYINYIEDNQYEVQVIEIDYEVPEELTFDRIVEDLKNCEARIEQEDYSGAITSARSLIEGVCKEILLINGVDTSNEKSNVPALFKDVRNVLNLDPSNEKLLNPLKEVITGLNKVVSGLNEIRNLSGDGHSGNLNPSKHHAILTVNSAKTIVSFLFQTYEYQKERGTLNKETTKQ